MNRNLLMATLALSAALTGEAQELAERAERFASQEAKRYELTVSGSKRPAKLQRLQNWTDPISSAYGALFCWRSDERPVAIASVYTYADNPDEMNAEFQSLWQEPLTAKRDGLKVWQPQTAGLTYVTIPDVTPAPTRRQRDLQMRQIARRFSAVQLSREDATPRQLRRLTSPLFSYGSNADAPSGGIFTFVVGTDPEVLLLIESTSHEGENPRWKYALARLSINALQVRIGEQIVWEAAEQMHPFERQSEPYSIKQAIPLRK